MSPVVVDALAVGAGAAAWFLNKIFGPSADLWGQTLADRFRARRDSAIQKAAELAQAAGIEPEPIPDSLLIPILQGASYASEEEMHERWTALLVSAATPKKLVLPSFPTILSQLSPEEARIVEGVYSVLDRLNLPPDLMTMRGADAKDIPRKLGIAPELFEVATENLIRLGLVATPAAGFDFVDNKHHRYQIQNRDVILCGTPLGRAFVGACNPKDGGGD